MADLSPNLTLLDHANGVVEPLYFDRQIVRASDLNLGRESRNAELDRMRRYTLGTGIVAGLMLIEKDGQVILTKGYGVSPSGNEVFLDTELELSELDAALKELCKQTDDACGLDANDGDGSVSGWLLIRPTLREIDKRPGISDDCGHPANTLRAARACHQIEVIVAKHLPDQLRVSNPDCADLTPFMCNGRPVKNIEIANAYDPQTDLLVLGQVTLTEEGITSSAIERRRLLPMQLMQEWIMACMCAAPPPPDDDDDQDGTKVESWLEFDDLLIKNGYDSALTDRPGLGTPTIPQFNDAPFFMTEEGVEKLEGIGISRPLAFLEADPLLLAETFGLEESQIERIRRVVATFVNGLNIVP